MKISTIASAIYTLCFCFLCPSAIAHVPADTTSPWINYPAAPDELTKIAPVTESGFVTPTDLAAHRPGVTFPGQSVISQATDIVINHNCKFACNSDGSGTDFFVTFGMAGAAIGGGLEWDRWNKDHVDVVAQYWNPDLDLFSVDTDGDWVIASGELRNQGAVVVPFHLDQSGTLTPQKMILIDDYAAQKTRILKSTSTGPLVEVLSGSGGRANWVQVSSDGSSHVVSFTAMGNPLWSVTAASGDSLVLSSGKETDLIAVDPKTQQIDDIYKMDSSVVGAPAAFMFEGKRILTNALGGELRTYEFTRNGLELIHQQKFAGLGNNIDKAGPFLALSQGQNGLQLGSWLQTDGDADVSKVVEGNYLSANEAKMFRMGEQSFVMLAGGIDGLFLYRVNPQVSAAPDQIISWSGPAAFFVENHLDQMEKYRDLYIRANLSNGDGELICYYVYGDLIGCNRPLPSGDSPYYISSVEFDGWRLLDPFVSLRLEIP